MILKINKRINMERLLNIGVAFYKTVFGFSPCTSQDILNGRPYSHISQRISILQVNGNNARCGKAFGRNPKTIGQLIIPALHNGPKLRAPTSH
jgi:hypothetical protein